ncbi:AAA family ATPase [Pinibacter soli]|uniref:ATP-binding protein n=1 Tax=Pinibacter soli TaxID=3044211 RepID=A0ABT6RHT9_9BACT|nr:ATP-binding protein [Pinibacter soli]MDI3321419.1 ATP-binding protein [Pinibacter soli]
MLISFSLRNFLSFKKEQTLDLTPEALKEHTDFLHVPYLYDFEARLLKAVGIFGHNSHGKSNFLKGYQFFLDFIFSSFKIGRSEESIPIENFKLNTSTATQPSYFEAKFYIREKKYRYGFKITGEKVVEEWLYYSESRVRENHLFVRLEQDFKLSKVWSKESEGKVDQSVFFTKPTNLLLSVLISQGSISQISEIAKWLKGNIIITDITSDTHLKRAILILSSPKYRSIINSFIEKADLGFVTIIEKIDSQLKNKLSLDKELIDLIYSMELDRFELYTRHDIYDGEYKKVSSTLFELLKSESSGTIKYFILACYLSYAIKEGQLIMVDELDSKFHVLLLKFLLKTFLSKKVNFSGSQMIFTTHSTFLLGKNILRRDQAAIVEKNEYGESSLKRLHGAKKPLRVDTQIEKEYTKGTLGGVSEKLKNENQLPFE